MEFTILYKVGETIFRTPYLTPGKVTEKQAKEFAAYEIEQANKAKPEHQLSSVLVGVEGDFAEEEEEPSAVMPEAPNRKVSKKK